MKPGERNRARAKGTLLRAIPVLLVCGWLGEAAAASGQDRQQVHTFAQLRLLPAAEAVKGVSVQIQGTVLCYDAGWGQLYVHDGSEVKYFSPQAFPMPLDAGMRVRITATTTYPANYVGLTNLGLVVQSRVELPRALPLDLADLAREFGQWVEIRGQVRVADTSRDRLALVLEDRGHTCLVFVMGAPPAEDICRRFVGSRVRVLGINSSQISNGRLQAASLFAPGLNEVINLEPAKTLPESLPAISVDSLLTQPLGAWTNDMVHIRGFISAYEPGAFVQVKDVTGVIRVEVIQITRAVQDDSVDAWGFLTVGPHESLLSDGYFKLVRQQKHQAEIPSPGISSGGPGTNRTLMHIAEVTRLTKSEAARGMPVRLRGTITFADPDWHNAFLEAQDGAVYVDLKQADVRSGEWVEVTGQTGKGGFAPEVVNATIRGLGKTNLPSPARLNLSDLSDGHWDAHWVELEGVVQRVRKEWGHVTLRLVTGRGTFRAVIPFPENQPSPDYLVDALVGIQGACSSELNARGQFSGLTLHVPGLEQIRVLQAAPADPFAVRATPVNKVATYDPEHLPGRRVKIAGIVTLPIVGQGFYVQDSSGGIRVSTQQTNKLHAGDVVEVLGFPAPGDLAPRLDEAVFRTTGTAALPLPASTTAEQILLRGTEDGMLVRLDARLLQDVPQSAAPTLVLQDGAFVFSARVAGQGGQMRLPAWRSGSLVRLTGVCEIQGTESHEPRTFRLLLANADNLELLQAAAWWTARHTLTLFGGLGLAVLGATSWIGSLRRQVRLQTDEIRQSHQRLAEASRQAGMAEVATTVLHNVGNVLNSVNTSAGILTDLVKTSKAREVARVSQLLEEHRADLASFLTRQDRGESLLSYLKALAAQLDSERATWLRELQELTGNIDHIKEIVATQQSYAKVSGVLDLHLPSALVEDVLRIHAEALTRHRVTVIRQFDPVPEILVDKHKVLQILINLVGNAKHALAESGVTAPRLTLRVHCNGDNRVRIIVEDNGVGIAPENLTRIFAYGFSTRPNGHGFGLHSGALAARELGGALLAASDGPGRGAAFTLELPARTRDSVATEVRAPL